MDQYTEKTKNWLNEQFRRSSSNGIYFAHQPIYGFRDTNCEAYVINRYIVTYNIIRALSHLKFESLLDVGGAEGYKAALVKSIFNSSVRNCDLSDEACNRAKEIFGVDGESVDIHNLPYEDNEYDVVLCSETLEHVSNLEIATKELIRVCKKAVIITVPHEPQEVINKNIRKTSLMLIYIH